MTDRYFIGTSTRTSAEVEGLPIVKVEEFKEFDGGAGNVANNLRDLGANSVLVATGPYPLKNRLLLDGVQVARFDQDDQCRPTDIEFVRGFLNKCRVDGVVVSDYTKGAITPELCGWLLAYCTFNAVPLFVNTKGNPGEWYHSGVDTTFVCNRHEYALWSDAYRRASQVIITQGADGVVRQHRNTIVESLPAFTSPSDVVSVNGAGDTFLAAYVYARLSGGPMPLHYANAASALVVRKPYTSTTTDEEVTTFIKARLKFFVSAS